MTHVLSSLGRAPRGIVAAAASLSACRTFSPDGGMDTVAMVAGSRPEQGRRARSARRRMTQRCRTRVTRLLHRPLSADAAVQIALLNNLGLQAAYNRLGIAEALAVKASRPPVLELCLLRRLDPGRARHRAADHRQHACRSLTMPARTKIAGDRIRAGRASRRGGDLARRGRDAASLYRARSRRARSWRRSARPRRSAEASAELAGQLKQTGAVNKLDQARRQVFATEMDAEFVGARQQAAAAAREAHPAHGAVAFRTRCLSAKRLAGVAGLDSRAYAAIEQDALTPGRRADGAAEMEAMAKSYGLTRKTHFLNVLDAAGISKTQKDRGEKRADGGGYRARAGSAAVRFRQGQCARGRAALSRSRQSARADRRERGLGSARGLWRLRRHLCHRQKIREPRCCHCARPSRRETELQYNAMQVDAFALLQAAREQRKSQGREHRGQADFWLASTDLSVAVLGGGSFASEPDAVIAATSSATNAE